MSVVSKAVPAALAVLCLTPGVAGAAGVVTKDIGTAERAHVRSLSVDRIMRDAKPMAIPQASLQRRLRQVPVRPDGPSLKIEGALPASSKGAAAAPATTASGTSRVAQNGAWGGSSSSAPAAQIGKLWFDTQIGAGERWSWCTATAVNTENKSTILTAGHCVYNPDPDGNNVLDGNGHFYENLMFCPGYQSGCAGGYFTARRISTSATWAFGTNKRFDMRDDFGAVALNRHATRGLLVDAVGGQGMWFNWGANNLDRHSFGYPITDSRWPAYSYTGEQLIYCPGRDTADSYGQLTINCTMTGGASGGPWLTWYNAGNGLGYVNSVNSNKGYGATTMSGPYFGDAELGVFNAIRAS